MSLDLTASELQQRLAGYEHILLDLGTGDGRFVRCMAEEHKKGFFIGLDACRENLHQHSRAKLPNMLFVIANAQALPLELNGLASQIMINFPWGSLLECLLNDHDAVLGRLASIARPFAEIDLHLNGEALSALGWPLESGTDQIQYVLAANGWRTESRLPMDARLLRSFPTTWAKRLAFGRDPRAIQLRVQRE
ncbi:MAG TPA: class I SAM-dependent methyltransferase, partial [Anaerolineales bacterium]